MRRQHVGTWVHVRAWLGAVAPAWIYTTGTAAGSTSFPVPTGITPATDYEFRLFANDGYTRLATSPLLTVI